MLAGAGRYSPSLTVGLGAESGVVGSVRRPLWAPPSSGERRRAAGRFRADQISVAQFACLASGVPRMLDGGGRVGGDRVTFD